MPIYKKRTFKDKILEVTPKDIFVECVFKYCSIHGYGASFRHCHMYVPEAGKTEPIRVNSSGLYVLCEGANNFDECEFYHDE